MTETIFNKIDQPVLRVVSGSIKIHRTGDDGAFFAAPINIRERITGLNYNNIQSYHHPKPLYDMTMKNMVTITASSCATLGIMSIASLVMFHKVSMVIGIATMVITTFLLTWFLWKGIKGYASTYFPVESQARSVDKKGNVQWYRDNDYAKIVSIDDIDTILSQCGEHTQDLYKSFPSLNIDHYPSSVSNDNIAVLSFYFLLCVVLSHEDTRVDAMIDLHNIVHGDVDKNATLVHMLSLL